MLQRLKSWIEGPAGAPDAPTIRELKERLSYVTFRDNGVHVDVGAYLATPRGRKALREAIPDSLLSAEERRARALERLNDGRGEPQAPA